MRGDVSILSQLVESLSDAIDKLEVAQAQNRIEDFNKIRNFILDLQKKINEEIS